MKKIYVYAAVFLCILCMPLYAKVTDPLGLLKKVDAATIFLGTDFSGEYALVQDKPGQGKTNTTAVMFRRDSEDKYLILITAPSQDKGKGYLKFDENLWFYDPADRRFTFTNEKDKFQDTNANTSDFKPQFFSRDYDIQSAEDVKLGSLNCVLFELKAKTANVDYPFLKLWVTTDDGLIRKKEDYSLSGQLLRTTAIPSYQKLENRSIPVSMLIVDNLRGKMIGGKMQNEKTQITITKPSFSKQNDSIYTKSFLLSLC